MTCIYCDELLIEGEPGNTHQECAFRMIGGSAAHHLHECCCFGGTRDDPPGMSKRDSARLALETYRLLHGENR